MKENRITDAEIKLTCIAHLQKSRTTAAEVCKEVDLPCRRKTFIQLNGTSIRKVRWCNCSSRNSGNGKCWTTNILKKVDGNNDHSVFRFISSGGGGGGGWGLLLPYMGYIGMRCPRGYGISTVLVINRGKI